MDLMYTNEEPKVDRGRGGRFQMALIISRSVRLEKAEKTGGTEKNANQAPKTVGQGRLTGSRWPVCTDRTNRWDKEKMLIRRRRRSVRVD